MLRGDEDIDRPDLLSLVQTHHAQVLNTLNMITETILLRFLSNFVNLQCILLGSSEDYGSGKDVEGKELEEIICKLNESMKSDIRQVSVWNTLGVLLLKAGHLQVQVLSFPLLFTVKIEVFS